MAWFGSKKKQSNEEDEDQQQQGGSSSRSRTRDQDRREPDERTRLLGSNTSQRNGYLDPDDPAVSSVSPYNLWTVRILRYFTVLFTIVTFVWWIILFVTIFVTPPGFNTRGSGFTDFSFACLTLGNLLLTLIFFAGPSRLIRVEYAVIAILLLVDMIIIVSVPRIRGEEGWVGIAAVVWALLMAIWTVLTDRVVAWGKREEEERLTGRAESRRTLPQWLGVLFSTIIAVIYIIIVILLTATLTLRAVDAGLEYQGERIFVDSDKYRIHLSCVGNITKDLDGNLEPTIILESGEVPSEYDFEPWLYNAYNNGTISRYCFYDRPGYAWSDNAPSPHSAGSSAEALSEALAQAGEEGPFISVSAGFGSIPARIFTAPRVGTVRGMLLIDPLHEDLLYRMASPSEGFALWGYGILSPLGFQRLGGAIFKGRNKQDRVYGKNVWSTGKFLKAKLQENLVADSLTKSEARLARNLLYTETPLAIVSSGIECGRDGEWRDKQKDLTGLTKNLLSWDVVSKAPHEVWKTQKGRDVLDKRLKQLVKATKRRDNDDDNGDSDDA